MAINWGIQPSEFWKMTPIEFSHVFNSKHGKKTQTYNGLSYEEYEDLQEFTNDVKAGIYG